MSADGDVSAASVKVRIQRLEQMIKRLEALVASGATFAGPVVANEAAAQAVNGLANGEQVFILSHRSIWTLKTGTAGTQGTVTQGDVGVPPLVAHEVINYPAAGGVGVLCRTNYSDPSLRIGVNNIFIDPATGNDENTGVVAGAPLQTGRELYRRWGWGTHVLVGCNAATSPDGFLTINIVTSINSPDSLDFVLIMQSNTSIRVRGGTPTNLRTGSLTAAPTAMARATNTRLRLTDAALASWAPFLVNNVRGRFTNGPAANGTFIPQVAVAAGVADCSACQTTNEPAFSQTATTVTPANGNAYVLEALVTVNFGRIDIRQELNPAFGGFQNFFNIIDCHIPSSGTQLFWAPRVDDSVFLNFYQCTNSRKSILWTGISVFLIASYTNEGWLAQGQSMFVSGGGALETATTTSSIFTINAPSGFIGDDFISEGITMGLTTFARVQNCAVFNVNNGTGHGFQLGSTTNNIPRGVVQFIGTAWGSGNTGRGIRVGSGCTAVGAAQVATGAGGDFMLATAAVGFWFDQTGVTALGTYQPAAGAIAFSWANLAAAKPGGFGGDAHAPGQDAHWVPAEAA